MIYSADITTTILVKLVTYRSFARTITQSATTIITWNSWQTHRHFKMRQEIRQKYYFLSIATYVRNWVRDCEIRIQDKRINNTRITPELFPNPRMGSRTGRTHANRAIARNTAKWRL